MSPLDKIMFELQNFKNILEETSNLLKTIKEFSKDDLEEIQLKIDSNIYALKRIASRIDDLETKELFLKSIENLFKSNNVENLTNFNLKNNSKKGNFESKGVESSDLIENELLKNTFKLKKMAGDFSESLKEDKKAIDKLTNRININEIESKNSLKILEKATSSLSTGSIMSFSFLIFIILYLFIRFF